MRQAAAKDASADKADAQALASDAAARAAQGHDVLLTITSSDVERGDTWQALLDAYIHIGQAANALLPGYSSTYGTTAEELATGSRSLRAAEAGLPPRCFTVTSSPGVGAPSEGAVG